MAATASPDRVAPPATVAAFSCSSRLPSRAALITLGATGLTCALVTSGVALGGLVHSTAPQQSAALTDALSQVQVIEDYADTPALVPVDPQPGEVAINALTQAPLTTSETHTFTLLHRDWTRLNASALFGTDASDVLTNADATRADLQVQAATLRHSLQQRAAAAATAADRQVTITRMLLLAAILGTLVVLGLALIALRRFLRPQRALTAVINTLGQPRNHVLDLSPLTGQPVIAAAEEQATNLTASPVISTPVHNNVRPERLTTDEAAALEDRVQAMEAQLREYAATIDDLHRRMSRNDAVEADTHTAAPMQADTDETNEPVEAPRTGPRTALDELSRMAADLTDTVTWFMD